MSERLTLNSPLTAVPGIGTYYAKLLGRLEIKTIENLLYHFPSRYQDFSLRKKVAELVVGDTITLSGQIIKLDAVRTRFGKLLLKGIFRDGTGLLNLLWFNQPYLKTNLPLLQEITLSGVVEANNNRLVIINPVIEAPGSLTHTGGLIAMYPETKGLSSKWLRSKIKMLINNLKEDISKGEYLPKELLDRFRFPVLYKALSDIHFPKDQNSAEIGRSRFAFEEFLFLHLATLKRKKEWASKKNGVKILDPLKKVQPFLNSLPFKLTPTQESTLSEILNDFAKEKPMNRLLQGDVGSGKTVVALAAIYTLHQAGYSSIYMAPTEILAKQHYATAQKFLTPFGIQVHLLTGNSKKSIEKDGPKADLTIGTHALLFRPIPKKKLGLVVIDEQHRFGVEQRSSLLEGVSPPHHPHSLTMTATPIPRTLALTLYGDLDLSVISELPPGRIPVKTWVVPPEKREAAYEWIKKQPGQTFIVCPFIEESETLTTVKAAVSEFEYLKNKIFPEKRLGLLHGRMKSREKETVMKEFREKELDILVATPVVEVGIDIPEATIMVIEGANHFGLASLHQLRGRVGRGNQQSYCLLFADAEDSGTITRLKSMEKFNNGLTLSEEDLKWRGPGQVFGTSQHGFLNLKMADINDYRLIKITNEAAQELLNNGPEKFPALFQKVQNPTAKNINPN